MTQGARTLTYEQVASILGEDAANRLFCRSLPDGADLDNPGDFLWASKMAEERSAGPLTNNWLSHD